MILASLCISEGCVEWCNLMGLYLQRLVRFRHLSHMLSHYDVQISSSIHARLFGSVRYCMLIWWGWKPKIYILSEPLSTCIAFFYVRSDTTMAQARLSCRCSHNILVCFISWHVFQIAFVILCLKKKPI